MTTSIRSLLILAILLAPFASGAADSPWLNRQVMPKMAAELKSGNSKVPIGEAGPMPWTVTKVNGDWLWVGRGWIKRDQVVPADQAKEYYSEVIRKHPKNAEAYVRRGIALATDPPPIAPQGKPPRSPAQ